MTRVIIDTSAWIESFHPKGEQKLKEIVQQLIADNIVLLPEIIKTEILRGTRTRKEYEIFEDLMGGLTYLPVDEDFWQRLAKFSFNLIRGGINIPLVDSYIALLAIENNASLVHRDSHFDLVAQTTELKVIKIYHSK